MSQTASVLDELGYQKYSFVDPHFLVILVRSEVLKRGTAYSTFEAWVPVGRRTVLSVKRL